MTAVFLLPPSEAKRVATDGPLLSEISAPPALAGVRHQIVAALMDLSADQDVAAGVLKLGTRQQHWLEINHHLDQQHCVAAIQVYEGVLYQALQTGGLPAPATAWLHDSILIFSALFGVVAPDEKICAYRLSAGQRLAPLPPLSHLWQPAIANYLSEIAPSLIVDLRSQPYRKLWQPDVVSPSSVIAPEFVHLKVWHRTAAGELAITSHANKLVKGKLLRDLALAHPQLEGSQDLADLLQAWGWEVWWDDTGMQVIPPAVN